MVGQVKSKKRVADYGEVFTSMCEVNAMLDMLKQETERIESRFLEPACGNGNFLAEVLKRKLEVVKKRYKKFSPDYEKFSIVALSSIYGVDILQDNVEECRERLFDIWNKEYTNNCENEVTDVCRKAASFILEKNILCGDALTMLRNDNAPIVFVQWDLITGSLIKRRDYRLDELLKGHGEQLAIEMILDGWEYDEEVDAMMPKPTQEYPLTDYRTLSEVQE